MNIRTIYPELNNNGTCEFRVWAPKAQKLQLIDLQSGHELPMDLNAHGYWETRLDDCHAGFRYKYKINGKDAYPDPASLSQPEGVHGPSEVLDLKDFSWTDQDWTGIPPEEMIQYEIHTGTFSHEQNFKGIIHKLDHLAELGINTLEIMPVARFSGSRNWGYDGVYPFAVQDSYGGAAGLMELVNACHEKGFAVILDVVYNHFGPEGNYVSRFGHYFAENYSTPWGKPINFDGPYSDGVRNYFIQNALMWCRDFHMDGLRLDAVHAIYDMGATHFLRELAAHLNHLGKETGKMYHLIAESNLNDVKFISAPEKGGFGLDAQWSDDFHHALHALVTKEKKGYYMDYGKREQLSMAIRQAFVYDGAYSPFRKKTYGSPTDGFPAKSFVIFNQNHDQVGNRKFGERLIELTDFETAKVAAGTMLISPYIPMLFMGEEYAERNPFLYFVSHEDEGLNKMVRKGRQQEFKSFYDDNQEAPDPASEATFEQSMLSWRIGTTNEKQAMFAFYKYLIRLRKKHPAINKADREQMRVSEVGEAILLERWQQNDYLIAVINPAGNPGSVNIPAGIKGTFSKLLDSSDEQWLGSGDVCPEKITANDQIAIPGKSIVLYANKTI
jgi:maltooligosyltrehalose trehalohydrolase